MPTKTATRPKRYPLTLTDAQIRRLKIEALKAGFDSPSEYIVDLAKLNAKK